ncbi:MAG: DUF1684 domain-containing protein [Bacteroidales bacterium]|jgi:uncharacterized protein (DUF1684 family)|nr:DUF1684 domain-containing protein [Bacteroidales bacterium]
MKINTTLSILLALFLATYACNTSAPVIQDEEAYIESIKQWQHERLQGLKDKDGWLNIAGIYWLKEGEQTLGSDPSNDIVFPEKAQAFIASLSLINESVHLKVNKDAELYYKNERVNELDLMSNSSENPSYISHGDLAWYIMKRHNSMAIRLRDYKNPAIDELDHIPSYKIDPNYVLEAEFLPFEEAKTITVNTPFQDYTQDYECPGELHFKLKGKKMKLLPFSSGEGYFIIISDETSGMETYGGGRFMYATPDSTGKIILDFNKAYNPPCAVTEFAACPLPPPENHLELKIEAGEKTVKGH